jgi:redox-sensitive bicupin YhaK (pirin superfamily)
MITLRPSNERGKANIGWLNSHHTFSFARYYDPRHMSFRSLRVINEDRVAGGGGFGTHPHQDMEIITYVLSGALAHRDSIGAGSTSGNHGTINPGDVQKMSAGTGVAHSEANAAADAPVHFLQIWIEPSQRGLEPSYHQAHFSDESKRNTLLPIAAPEDWPDASGALPLFADAALFASRLEAEQSVSHKLQSGRAAWIQIIEGTVEVNGQQLQVGDGAAIENESEVSITAREDAHFLLFDLA